MERSEPENPPPWGLKPREDDAELKQNSEDMRKFAAQPEVSSEKFNTHIGMNILTEEDKRERRRARFAEEEPFEDDVDHRDKDNIPKLGWPKQKGVVSKPYFYHAAWYQEWSENDLVAYRIPERSQDEIDDYRSRRTRHILDIMNPELLRALRKLRGGELRSNDKIFKTLALHETQDALWHGSRAMHVVLARAMDDGFAQVRLRLKRVSRTTKATTRKFSMRSCWRSHT